MERSERAGERRKGCMTLTLFGCLLFFLGPTDRETCSGMLKNETDLRVFYISSGISSSAHCSPVHFGKRDLPCEIAQSVVPAKVSRPCNICHILRSRCCRL